MCRFFPDGGMISAILSALSIKDSIFIHGTGRTGGVIYYENGDEDKKLIINNCTFKNNLVTQSGGALRIIATEAEITNSYFFMNRAF